VGYVIQTTEGYLVLQPQGSHSRLNRSIDNFLPEIFARFEDNLIGFEFNSRKHLNATLNTYLAASVRDSQRQRIASRRLVSNR
jgi:hypothetical protein